MGPFEVSGWQGGHLIERTLGRANLRRWGHRLAKASEAMRDAGIGPHE